MSNLYFTTFVVDNKENLKKRNKIRKDYLNAEHVLSEKIRFHKKGYSCFALRRIVISIGNCVLISILKFVGFQL